MFKKLLVAIDPGLLGRSTAMLNSIQSIIRLETGVHRHARVVEEHLFASDHRIRDNALSKVRQVVVPTATTLAPFFRVCSMASCVSGGQ